MKYSLSLIIGALVWLLTIFVSTAVITPYAISSDQWYVSHVNPRAFNYLSTDSHATDFADAQVLANDAMNDYEGKAWKLQHQELYYIQSIIGGGIIGFILGFIAGGISYSIISSKEDEERDREYYSNLY